MLEEGAQEDAGLLAGGGAAGMWSADTGPWQRALHCAGAHVVHVAELLDRPQPIVAVGLVPDFPRPGRDLVFTVAIGQMPGPGFDQGAPFPEIVGWRCPAGGDGCGFLLGLPAVLIGSLVIGKRLRCEPDLHQRD